ncbi:MAG: tetratricopeptide repeat protein, partial [Stackebrandtia sp.]
MNAIETAGTVILCTAMDVEYQAVRELFHGPTTQDYERGTRYEIGRHSGCGGEWTTVLVLIERDNTPAAVQVERAIAKFRPQLVLLVGVAGGRRDSRLGDVIAATQIYHYESGLDTDEAYLPRIKT